MTMSNKITRRLFGQKTTVSAGLAFGLAALDTGTVHGRIIGANDTIQLAFVGVANRGRQLMDAFGKCEKNAISAMADADKRPLSSAREKYAPNCYGVQDFRILLDRNDVDAMVIAAPDQWHALMCIESCKAGKNVYIESPVSSTIKEGRAMINAAEKYKRIVQVGLYRRSDPMYHKLAKIDLDQKLGKVACVRSGYTSNMYPKGMGKAQPVKTNIYFNWNLWLGPKPYRSFQENIAPYKFRWWKEYSSQIAIQGVPLIDIVRWLLREEAPVSVCSMGGKFAIDDDRTIPDTMETIFQFASGRIFSFSCLESSGNPIMATDDHYNPLGFIELRGTKGTLYPSNDEYTIKPERGGQFQDRNPRMKEEHYIQDIGNREGNGWQTQRHAQNFLDCIRSGKTPNCPLIEAHRSTVMSIMANISLEVGRRLYWDPVKEEFIKDPEANKFLHYEYRAPWKL